MKPSLHLPPSAFDFEGFTETEAVKYKDSTVSHNGRAVSKVVQTTKVTAYSNINLRGKPTAGSSQQIREEPEDFQNSRLEILRAANGSEFPECVYQTINLMTETIQKSSEGDYQSRPVGEGGKNYILGF